MSIREKVLQALRRYDLLDMGDRVLVAVSGGQDSLTLLHLLHELSGDLQISLAVGHLHHGLRGAATDADQRYVGELAARLGLPFTTDRTDVAALGAAESVGLEEAGRRARYRFFDRAADEHGCQKIALAHTATDRAETLMMNLFRGAGLTGLRSIPPCRGRIIRPLLLVSRQETLEFCRITNLEVRADSTNDDPHPLRNRVRAGLLPQLEQEYGPGVEAALCRAAEHLWDEIEWTEPLVAEAGEAATEGDGLSVTTLQSLPTGLRHRVLRQFVAAAGHPLRDLSQERWEALEALALKGQTGRRLELSPDLGVEVSYGVLRVVGPDEATPADDVEVRLQVPGQAELPGGGCLEAALGPDRPALPAADAPEAVLDAAHAGPVLVVRRARPGDSFIPLGMAGRKKLQDYFVDNKVPPRQRRPWVVTRADGEILWIVGYRLSDSACVRDATSQFLTLRLCGPG